MDLVAMDLVANVILYISSSNYEIELRYWAQLMLRSVKAFLRRFHAASGCTHCMLFALGATVMMRHEQ